MLTEQDWRGLWISPLDNTRPLATAINYGMQIELYKVS